MRGHHARAEALFDYFRREDEVPENHLLGCQVAHTGCGRTRRRLLSSRLGGDDSAFPWQFEATECLTRGFSRRLLSFELMSTRVKEWNFTILAAPIDTFRRRARIMAIAFEADPGRKFLLQCLCWAGHGMSLLLL
jgi:hypothetical protein